MRVQLPYGVQLAVAGERFVVLRVVLEHVAQGGWALASSERLRASGLGSSCRSERKFRAGFQLQQFPYGEVM
jgi:hypothetical protein